MKKSLKIFLIVSSVLLLAATTGLTIALVAVQSDRAEAESRLDSLYEKSYFDALDCLNDVRVKLKKITVLSGASLRPELLADVWRESELAATSLSQLGSESQELDDTIKFLNQLSDYARYLSKRKNENLSTEEKENLLTYAELVTNLCSDLRLLQEKLIKGDSIDAGALSDYSLVSDAIKTYSSVEYPEMIYDGPFSDGLNDRETKYLSDKQTITQKDALNMATSYFPNATDLRFVGESNATIPAYLFSFRLGRNEGTVALTKQGGCVLNYNAYCLIDDPQLSESECVERGNAYVAQMGYADMEPVWVDNNDSTVYINYAYSKNGVVYYPDLVKLKVCAQTGDLLGVEAQNYLYNHTEREVTLEKSLSLDLDDSLQILSQTYCVIPTETNREIEAKEIVAAKNDTTYYLYFDLDTGEEIRCLVVIEENGKVLL